MPPLIIRFFKTRFTCSALIHFLFLFVVLLSFESFFWCLSLQIGLPCSTSYCKWHPLCVSLKLSFWCAWPLQTLLNEKMCSLLSQCSDPVGVALSFSSRMLGVIHAMSKSNVWLIVSLCSWPRYIDSALLHCCYLEVLALLMTYLLKHQSISWGQVLPYFSFYFLELCYKLVSYNFLKNLACIYLRGWAHHSRKREGELSCYGCSGKAFLNFIYIFVPFSC